MAEIAALEAKIHQLEIQLADDIPKFKNLKHFTYRGTTDENLDAFQGRFQTRMQILEVPRKEYHVLLPNYIDLQAYSFYRRLSKRIQENSDLIVEALKVHFASNGTWLNNLKLNSIRQRPHLSRVNHTFTKFHDLSGFEDDNPSIACYVRGLHHHVQLDVFRQRPKNLNDAFLAARFAKIARTSCIEQIPLVSSVVSQPEKALEVFNKIASTLESVVSRLDEITTRVNKTHSRNNPKSSYQAKYSTPHRQSEWYDGYCRDDSESRGVYRSHPYNSRANYIRRNSMD